MWYNEITFEEKAVKNKHKKRNSKNFKEKVDNVKLECYINHRYRERGKKIYQKKVKKKLNLLLTLR